MNTHSPSPTQAPAILFPVPMNVAAPGTSREWGHAVLSLQLAYFTQRNVLKAHPCCSRCQIPF